MLEREFDKYIHFSFDLDGTLIDSLMLMETAWGEVNKRTGIAIPFLNYKRFIGLPFEQILVNLGIVEGVSEIKKIYFDTTASLVQEIKLFDGAADLLERLSSRSDVYVTIITSKPTENAKSILEIFDIPHSTLVGGDMTPFGKPFRDPFLRAEENLGISRDLRARTIYFGDMVNDFIFTRNCEIDYCHCNFGFHGPLSKHIRSSHMSIDSLRDIIMQI